MYHHIIDPRERVTADECRRIRTERNVGLHEAIKIAAKESRVNALEVLYTIADRGDKDDLRTVVLDLIRLQIEGLTDSR